MSNLTTSFYRWDYCVSLYPAKDNLKNTRHMKVKFCRRPRFIEFYPFVFDVGFHSIQVFETEMLIESFIFRSIWKVLIMQWNNLTNLITLLMWCTWILKKVFIIEITLHTTVFYSLPACVASIRSLNIYFYCIAIISLFCHITILFI